MHLTMEDIGVGVIGVHGVGITFQYGCPDGTCGFTHELAVAMGAAEAVMQDDAAVEGAPGEYHVTVVKPLPDQPAIGFAEMPFLTLTQFGWKIASRNDDMAMLAAGALRAWC